MPLIEKYDFYAIDVFEIYTYIFEVWATDMEEGTGDFIGFAIFEPEHKSGIPTWKITTNPSYYHTPEMVSHEEA